MYIVENNKPKSETETYFDPSSAVDILAALEADRHAHEMDGTLLYLEDMDPENCPPDTVYDLGDREAWVYEHDNIAELIFVRT